MKKYILSALALLSIILTSCKNDDITIGAPSTISVNAAGVVSNFEDYKAGELELLDAGQKLRLRALIYNSKGELVAQQTDYYSNYNIQLKTSEFLSPGTYTIIGISDVVAMEGSSVTNEWWTLSGQEKLSDMVIKDQGMIGYSSRILGIGKTSLVVQESRSNSAMVDLKPVGALIYVFLENTASVSHRNFTEYKLKANKTSDAISFNNNGDYSIVEEYDPEYDYIIALLEPKDGYLYNYILPMNNVDLWFVVTEDGKDKTFPTDEGATLNIQSGDEFLCELIMNSSVSKIETYYKPVALAMTRGDSNPWSANWRERIGFNRINNGGTNEKRIKIEEPFLDIE